MGTGVGEAMIIGAITGAGTSAITGGDPLKGALMGAAGGGLGAGVGGALGGQAAGTAVGSTAAAPIVTAGSTAAGSAAAAPVVAGQAAGTAGFESALSPVLGGQGSYAAGFVPPDITTSTINQAAVPPQTVPKVGFKDLFSTDMIPKDQPQDDFQTKLANYLVQNPMQVGSTAGTLATSLMPPDMPEKKKYSGALSRFRYDPDRYNRSFADGGITDLPATKRLMRGGDLGSYSDGGRLLKGPGDGMSDNIPARIGKKQPARLADGEFVVPADVVSGIGNGSTDAGARRLYAMMDKVRQARTGKKKQGREIKSDKYMPA